MSRLKELPAHMQTKAWIKSEIRYEQHMGDHTYSQCDCNRRSCRASMCDLCWRECLEEIKKKVNAKAGGEK